MATARIGAKRASDGAAGSRNHGARYSPVPEERNTGFHGWPYDYRSMNQRGSKMSRAEQYRHLATDVLSRASRESNPILRAEWENLAETYVRLAEQSDDERAITYDPIQDLLNRTRH